MQANDANELRVGAPPQAAAGPRAVAEAMRQVMAVMPPSRALPLLMRVNQSHGFDCPGCAWPEPSQPSRAEFCENGAKALAAEATTHTVDAEFFAEHSVADLLERSDHWLGSRGRLARPMYRREGATNSNRSSGTRRLPWWPSDCGLCPARMRRRFTHLGAPVMRRRFCISSLPGDWAPTTCPTAQICATSPAEWR